MKAFLIITSLILTFNHRTFSQHQCDSLNPFYENLDSEYAKNIKSLIKSYDNFLELNYNYCNIEGIRTTLFLIDYYRLLGENRNLEWKIPDDSNIIRDFENSGLRKQIWIYESECIARGLISNADSSDYVRNLNYEEEIFPLEYEIDSVIHEGDYDYLDFNLQGDYLETLNKVFSNCDIIKEYIETRRLIGYTAPSLLIQGLLYNSSAIDYEKPLYKLIISIDLYYDILKDIK